MRFQRQAIESAIIAAAVAAAWWVPVAGAASSASSIADLSLEELMNIQVISGSKKPQRVADSAAAVFVITADDIRRSGATSIPEALRLAPGVEVARFGSNKWSVSIRGSNGRFANKLLVLLDGRSLYMPLFAGVQWDVHDTRLEDVERIEVIRGPGASLWGANAVNGVVNIITRHAKDTLGAHAVVGAGNVERAFGSVRYGAAMDDGAYRVFAKGFARDRFPDAAGQPGRDDWNSGLAGFRMDRTLAPGSELMVQANAYRGRVGEELIEPRLVPPYAVNNQIDQASRGANLLVRWDRDAGGERASTLQAFIEGVDFSLGTLGVRYSTFDIEYQQRLPVGASQDLMVGVGYRLTRDDITSTETINISPGSRSAALVSLFAQDEITLLPNTLRLTLGARLEHNAYTGVEIQPNARLLWTPAPTHSLWTSAARAVRTPSRAERDASIRAQVTGPFTATNPGPLPAAVELSGAAGFDSERLHSLEAGYRHQISPRASIDFALFHHGYEGLRAFGTGTPTPQLLAVPPYIQMPVTTSNGGSGHVRGWELAAEVRPSEWWRLVGSMTHQRLSFSNPTGVDTQLVGSAPRRSYSLRSSMNLGTGVEFDLWLRHVDSLPAFDIASYTTLDTRLGWKATRNLDVAIVGQNLLDRRHPEYVSDFVGTSTYQVPRGGYVRLDWKF